MGWISTWIGSSKSCPHVAEKATVQSRSTHSSTPAYTVHCRRSPPGSLAARQAYASSRGCICECEFARGCPQRSLESGVRASGLAWLGCWVARPLNSRDRALAAGWDVFLSLATSSTVLVFRPAGFRLTDSSQRRRSHSANFSVVRTPSLSEPGKLVASRATVGLFDQGLDAVDENREQIHHVAP